MRISFLLTQDLESPSGLGRYAPLARELSRLGHTVGIVALHSNYSELEIRKYEKDGIQIQYVAPMHVLKKGSQKFYYSPFKLITLMVYATFQLARAAIGFHPDIIYVCKPHPMNSLAGQVVHLISGSAFYLDCDDDEAGSNTFHGRWQQAVVAFFERQAPRWAMTVTTNTYVTLKRIQSRGIQPKQLVYLPNGFDLARFSSIDHNAISAVREALHLGSGPVILYVGSLSLSNHPVDLLIDAYHLLKKTLPEVQLVLVGGGEDIETLRNLSIQLGLGSDVHFCGRVPPDQVQLYYSLADVSVDPVRDDLAARARLPLKMFESWAYEVPFISGMVGDRLAIVGETHAGILTQPGDAKALSEALYRVLIDANLAATLRCNGLEQVKKYTWDRLACILNARIRQDFSSQLGTRKQDAKHLG